MTTPTPLPPDVPVASRAALADQELLALYGPWEPPALTDLARLLDPLPWWVTAGWALELASGVPRDHKDVDIAVPRRAIGDLIAHLSPTHHLWVTDSGSLTPLRYFTQPHDEISGMWIRRDATAPWELDIQLTPVDGDRYVYKRDARIRLPMSEAIIETRGIPHLAPHVALLHKAHHERPTDQADFEAVLPRLTRDQRLWLRDALEVATPQSSWRARISATLP